MAQINVLDSSIYNKISAGEVVERPASVIKELTENSVDAGAKNITIEIKNGGIDEMIVTDDGCGIEYDSVKNAFLPHATSKIQSVQDLESIRTLGFRGEALASIASVSQVEMLTKVLDDDLATRIELEGGNIKNFERCSAPTGTKISVKNLFFNVPARKKFLKKPKQEEHEITTVVQRLILSNPEVSIRYVVDNKQVYYSTGKSLEDAIFAVYGLNVLQNLLHFDEKREDMHLYGYIGKPSFTKPNRTYQTLVVNGRYVQNTNISVAVNKGFETHLMKGQFPFFIMFLAVNPEKIDVNVHPTKLEIRFDDNSTIFSFVYRTVSNTILSNQDLYTIDMINKPIKALNNEPLVQTEQQSAFSFDNIFDNNNNNQNTSCSNKNNIESFYNNDNQQNNLSSENNINPQSIETPNNQDISPNYIDQNAETKSLNNYGEVRYDDAIKSNKLNDYSNLNSFDNVEGDLQANPFNNANSVHQGNTYKLKIFDSKNDEVINIADVSVQSIAESEMPLSYASMSSKDVNGNTLFSQNRKTYHSEGVIKSNDTNSRSISMLKNGYKVVGKLFNTFLFVESGESAILIDQHAAHERIIYDRFQKYYGNKDKATQPLLVPYILEVNFQEKSFLEQNIKQFTDLGFVIEEFGDKAYKISAVPLLLGGNFDCKSFFNDILSQVGKEIKVKESLHFDEYLMQRACKSAIKAGNDMSENEICTLVDAVLANNTELFCPHGRPIAIKIDRKDIEKWFKRVL